MPISNLTLSTIQRNATVKSFQRGQDYFDVGAVISLIQRQQTLYGEVEGNSPVPYTVTVEYDGGGITETYCTCPYDYGGWCKHQVATLLACLYEPEAIEKRPSLAQLLDQLNPIQTQGLVQALVEEEPGLMDFVESYVMGLGQPVVQTTTAQPRPQRQTNVDPAPFKRRAKDVLRNAVRNWEEGWDEHEIDSEMGELLDEALAFAEHGDGYSTLIVLQGITEGCVENWDEVSDYGVEPEDAEVNFDAAWTEAILSTELTDEEVLIWQERLELWQDELGSFAMSLEALRQGWNYPPLLRVLRGESPLYGAWGSEPPTWATEFTQIRLQILERLGRYEDYLQLAKVEGQTQSYLTMLGKLGRIEEAMSAAPVQMKTLDEAKSLAEILREQNHLSEALEISRQGIYLDCHSPYIRAEFADWTSNLAEGLGNEEAALKARIVAFKAKPSFQDYQKIAELTPATWSELKGELLAHLRSTDSWTQKEEKVNIFLHEGLFDEAIATVTQLSSYQSELVLQVMAAVMNSHSQWVVDNARPRAESIIDRGKAKYYYYAVEWLKQVRAGYLAMGKESDWLQYREELVDAHGLKRKLMGLMREAGL